MYSVKNREQWKGPARGSTRWWYVHATSRGSGSMVQVHFTRISLNFLLASWLTYYQDINPC